MVAFRLPLSETKRENTAWRYCDAFPNARAGWLEGLGTAMDSPDRLGCSQLSIPRSYTDISVEEATARPSHFESVRPTQSNAEVRTTGTEEVRRRVYATHEPGRGTRYDYRENPRLGRASRLPMRAAALAASVALVLVLWRRR